jgi:hypothetical protein
MPGLDAYFEEVPWRGLRLGEAASADGACRGRTGRDRNDRIAASGSRTWRGLPSVRGSPAALGESDPVAWSCGLGVRIRHMASSTGTGRLP